MIKSFITDFIDCYGVAGTIFAGITAIACVVGVLVAIIALTI